MTPEEFDEEVRDAPARAFGMMAQAKESSHIGQIVPPVLNAMRMNGSTLQLSGPPNYTVDQEVQAVVRMLRLAEVWEAEHAIVALDTARVFDPARVPSADERTEANLFEATIADEAAVNAILTHGFDQRNGRSAEALTYDVDDADTVEFAEESVDVDESWLDWAEIPHALEQCITPRTDFIGGPSFESEAASADQDQYGVFSIEYAGENIHVRVWGNTYREEEIPGYLLREEITSHIQRIFAASRIIPLPSGWSPEMATSPES